MILYTYYKTKSNLFLKTVKICVFLFIQSKIEEGKISKIFGVVWFYFKKGKNSKPMDKKKENRFVKFMGKILWMI